MKVLIAAGGTGGHINPGIAIANKIKKEEPSAKIIFVGTNKGIEKDLVPKAGYELKMIRSAGISKKINIDNFKNITKILLGIKDSSKLIKEFKPDVVIGTGGYVSAPVFFAASMKKVPTILHESNAFPGKTVRLLSKRVDKVLAGFEETKKRLPNAKETIITGTPTKMNNLQFSSFEKSNIINSLGLDNTRPIVLVFGGSQGAKKINEAMIQILSKKDKKEYQIIFAPGPKQYEFVKEELQKANVNIEKIEGVKILPYIYNMEQIMNIADLVVSRSGAMTITEISIVGVASILIPFPFAAEDHQNYNAKVLEKIDSAKIILDKDLDGRILENTICSLIKDKTKLKQMGQNARKIAINDSQERIYKQIKLVCKNR